MQEGHAKTMASGADHLSPVCSECRDADRRRSTLDGGTLIFLGVRCNNALSFPIIMQYAFS